MVYLLDPCSFLHIGILPSSLMVLRSAKRCGAINLECCINDTEDERKEKNSLVNHLETAHQRFVNTHHSAGIVEFTTVIWRGEKCDELSLGEKFIAIFNHLMRPAYEIHIVTIQELRHDVWTECERDSSVVFAPTLEH